MHQNLCGARHFHYWTFKWRIEAPLEGPPSQPSSSTFPLSALTPKSTWTSGPCYFLLLLCNPCPWALQTFLSQLATAPVWREGKAARSVRERNSMKSEAQRTAWRRRSRQLASCISELLIASWWPGLCTYQ